LEASIVRPREGPRAGPEADRDQALVDRARRGDADAFGDLVRAYQHRIVNFTRAMLTDAADAEDVAQEAFLRAYRGLRGFRGGSSFKTWLYQIAANTARTHLARRRDRPEQAAGDPAATPEAFGQPATGEDVETAVIHRDRLDRALQALPEDMRLAVVLRDVQGLDYAEIAETTGVPIGTVESRIFRGRARLRALITGSDGASGARGESS
jgi:RNA polymerase sigma-70 factor, ECF subfamily